MAETNGARSTTTKMEIAQDAHNAVLRFLLGETSKIQVGSVPVEAETETEPDGEGSNEEMQEKSSKCEGEHGIQDAVERQESSKDRLVEQHEAGESSAEVQRSLAAVEKRVEAMHQEETWKQCNNHEARDASGVDTTQEEAAWTEAITVLAAVLVLMVYVIGILYRATHPILVPLPTVEFHPWNISRVSVSILTPQAQTSVHLPLHLDWEITNFPASAITEQGPEPFQYRVYLNGRTLLTEVGFWQAEDIVGEGEEQDARINKTMHHLIRSSHLDANDQHEIRVEVTFPIPGSDDELVVLSDAVNVTRWKPDNENVVLLKLLSPQNGVTIPIATPVHIEYTVANIARIYVRLDKKWGFWKSRVEDGTLMLDRLGPGHHELEMQGFDAQGRSVAMSQLQFAIDDAGKSQ